MRKTAVGAALAVIGLAAGSLTAGASAPSGAIFTTNANGSRVNENIYPSKDAVYLDGGPGPAAPATAAGLPDGTYVFQVTDPSGKTLLSTDFASCRQFTVSGGLITGVAPSGSCAHLTGVDQDHGATTVQLMPYNDTPNHGGVYKAWATPVSAFPSSCLGTVDCNAAGTFHGFAPSQSKTDNFKVKTPGAREIDTVFFSDLNGNGYYDAGDVLLGSMLVVWTDTLGVQNNHWSDPAVNYEAHVEAVENGTHYIAIQDQAGCTVGQIGVWGSNTYRYGPQTLSFTFNPGDKDVSMHVFVACLAS